MMQTKSILAGQRKGSSCVKSQTYQGAATKNEKVPGGQVAPRKQDVQSLHQKLAAG